MSDASDEWLFDYLIAVFKSERWEYNVLQFIDENCHLFNNDETHDFALTEAHQKFRNLIDGLLTQHLAEIGVSEEAFVQACEHGRNNSASRQVFEQIMAVDDFLTFKKLMVKRNMELEFEVVKAMAAQGHSVVDSAPQSKADEAKQLEAALEASKIDQPMLVPEDPKKKLTLQREDQHAAEFNAAVRANKAATDLYQQQLALEQAELEQALTISLQLEEERLRAIQAAASQVEGAETSHHCAGGFPVARINSAKVSRPDEAKVPAKTDISHSVPISDAKAAMPNNSSPQKPTEDGAPRRVERASAPSCALRGLPDRGSCFGVKRTGAGFSSTSTDDPVIKRVAEPKRASPRSQMGRVGNSRALPPIQPGRAGISLSTTDHSALPSMQRQLETQRNVVLSSFKQTEKVAPLRALSTTAPQSLSTADLEAQIAARAAHMRRQRELIIAKKRAEREAKLKKSEAQKEIQAPASAKTPGAVKAVAGGGKWGLDPSEALTCALARRMKLDMLDIEHQHTGSGLRGQFAQMDRQLRAVEQLREQRQLHGGSGDSGPTLK